MNAIVLVVDHLQAGYLGCYGNSWIATPCLDRLASQSFLFDHALLESPAIDHFYDACWAGISAIGPRERSEHDLPTALQERQVQTALVSDKAKVLEHPSAADWRQRVAVEVAAERAKGEHDCQFARVFAAAADWLAQAQEPFVLWTHFRGMAGPWDAPLEFRQRYFEDDEISVPDFLDPPCLRLTGDADPDELLAIRWSYAAQVSLFDACLAEFLELIDTPELLANTLLVLTSPRGYPLGEHGLVGFEDDHGKQQRLHEELVHVPLLIRMPRQEAAALRSQGLVQPGDLHATLWELFALPPRAACGRSLSLLPLIRGEVEAVRDCVLLSDGPDKAIRTPAWYLKVRQTSEGEPHRQLFVKPDDRWEVNEVADRCPDIADRLEQTLSADSKLAEEGERGGFPPLDDELVFGL